MRIVSNGVQPYIVQTGVDTDGETQEEVTTFRMKLDISECPNLHPETKLVVKHSSNELTPLTSLSMTNTPSIITKTPAALLLIQGGRRGEEPSHTSTSAHTNTGAPKHSQPHHSNTRATHIVMEIRRPGDTWGFGESWTFAVFIV
ncbi:hypothetical protein DPX16_6902 [Anabarilius grahami]|uniref:Uncharacterized protein n=1 Tax=Anabarilius grahami TaxID=495550 RepID=A0A3N0Y5X9_ANAGA|nr:hypothetical protein DPX16_6902 [Anabarilius grahami]